MGSVLGARAGWALAALLCAHQGLIPPASAAPTEVRVGYIRIAECAPIYVAIERGMFERQGLALRLSEFTGGQTILPQVSSGVLDIGFTNLVSLIRTKDTLRCKSLAGASFEDARHVNHALLAQKNAETDPSKRTEPLRVAVNTRDNVEELAFRRWAATQGWSPSAFVIQPLAFDRMGLALLADTIDISSSVEPYITRLTRSGGTIVVLAHQYAAIAPEVAVATWATSERWARDNPAQLAAFRAAFAEAVAFIATNESEARTIIGQYTGISADLLASMGLPGFRASLEFDDCQPVIGAMKAEGWLTGEVKPSDILLNR